MSKTEQHDEIQALLAAADRAYARSLAESAAQRGNCLILKYGLNSPSAAEKFAKAKAKYEKASGQEYHPPQFREG